MNLREQRLTGAVLALMKDLHDEVAMKATAGRNRLVSTVFALVLLFAFLPDAAFADQTVTIWQGQPVASMRHDIQLALDIAGAADSGTITVLGKNHWATETLAFNIPKGVTLSWRAELTGEVKHSTSFFAVLVSVSGEGVMNIEEGALISVRSVESAALECKNATTNITGGEVSCTAASSKALVVDGCGLYVAESAFLRCTEARSEAIYAYSGAIAISGGSIQVSGESSYGVYTEYASVWMSGGKIEAFDKRGTGIWSLHASVKVTSGEIITNGEQSYGISMGESQLLISGGTITAQGFGCKGVGTISGDIIIVGGLINASGDESNCIEMIGFGAVAYLKGTVSGSARAFCSGSETDAGTILEVDVSATPPEQRQSFFDRTGLIPVAQGESENSVCIYFWCRVGGETIIVLYYPLQGTHRIITWPGAVPSRTNG